MTKTLGLSELQAQHALWGAGTAASQITSMSSSLQSSVTSVFGPGVVLGQLLLGAIVGAAVAVAEEREKFLNQCLSLRAYTVKAKP